MHFYLFSFSSLVHFSFLIGFLIDFKRFSPFKLPNQLVSFEGQLQVDIILLEEYF
jgi:hypothetical protein